MNTEILAISTDRSDGARYAVENFGALFPILFTESDDSVPRAYGAFDLHGDGLASASAFVVDTKGGLAYRWVSGFVSDQITADELLVVLENLQS